jgi:hypothetical protein
MNKKTIIIIFLVVAFSVLTYFMGAGLLSNNQTNLQTQVMPGKLSAAHASLSTSCNSCHTANQGGIDEGKCISCHGSNTGLLQRKPTAFHAIVGNCASCHTEHLGVDANMRVMNHEALAKIAATIVGKGKNNSIVTSNPVNADDYPFVSQNVARLNCATCHSTKDKHVGLMGVNCGTCHSATEWTIPAFQHPSVNSINCAQCHQAPPSHYMMHFEMIDKTVAAAQGNGCCGTVLVNQCYNCHQTTSFNDIKGVGYYKHH